MLPTYSYTKRLIIAVTVLYAQSASAEVTGLSASDMIQNIANQVPNLMRFVTALGYVMGMYFIFWGILKLKQYGEMRTQMSSGTSLKAPLLFLIVGAMLLYLPTTVQMGTSTFWADTAPTAYVVTEGDQWSSLLNACILVVQLFGTIAFIRGLVMLTHLAGHGGQPGQLNKALVHMVGGIFCINIYAFVQVIFATLGVTYS